MKKQNLKLKVESVSPFTENQQDKIYQKLKEIVKKPIEVQFSLNPRLLSGAVVKVNGKLLDVSVAGQLKQFQDQLDDKHLLALDIRKIGKVLEQEISEFQAEPTLHEVGQVLSISDGISKIQGLSLLGSGEEVQFSSGAKGIALNLNPIETEVVVLNKPESIMEGDFVLASGHSVRVPVGVALLGRVINPLGEPLDNKTSLKNLEHAPVFVPAPGIIERDRVEKPIQTGVKAIDALVPIGRGQRELIIGDRQTGKTSLALDMILSQKLNNTKTQDVKEKVICVYVAIGQKQSTVRNVLRTLHAKGAMDYTIVVSATASDTAAMQYLAPYAGCTIAEHFRDLGYQAMIIYDDLSKHAVAYREMSLLLKRPAGREAYPGDVFYLHSRLLERAAQMSKKQGGGSLTAIPIIETLEGDVSAYIPTNVISITDGQIFLDSPLFPQGVRPAINVGLSVSRVGSVAQTKAMKQVSGSLKLELSQYREMLNFAQLSSDLDASTKALLERGKRITEVLKQNVGEPLTMAEEVLSLLAVEHGIFDTIQPEEITTYLEGLLRIARLEKVEMMAELETKKILDPELENRCVEFIEAYVNQKKETAEIK